MRTPLMFARSESALADSDLAHNSGGGGRGLLEVLMRRAVVAPRQRCPLARLALARGRAAAPAAAVEQAGLDLLLDERRRRTDALSHRPRDLRLGGDGEVAPDVCEERPVGSGEVVRVLGQPLHRLLALEEHRPPVLELRAAVG